MLVLVTYDVATVTPGGARRLRQVSKACREFEIEVDPAEWTKLKARLEAIIDTETDSLRYYHLGAEWQRRVEHVGAKPATDLNGPLII